MTDEMAPELMRKALRYADSLGIAGSGSYQTHNCDECPSAGSCLIEDMKKSFENKEDSLGRYIDLD